MKKIARAIPHLAIALLLGLQVFVVLDGFNPLMQWLNSGVSKIYITATCVVGLIACVLCVVQQRRRPRRTQPRDGE
ncbi:MAG: hypothetical protein K6G17_00475 [Oscillospiraceae bacterium]|nr:hypothetical protein [Oscillospiraceae bacterium]